MARHYRVHQTRYWVWVHADGSRSAAVVDDYGHLIPVIHESQA